MKKTLISFLLAMTLVLGGATAAMAQESDAPQTSSDDDDGFDEWGLLGLLGLAGLAGLKRRDNDDHRNAGNRNVASSNR